MYSNEIIIDAKGHLLGRLASIVAKELLNGQRVTLVRCEGILMSGSPVRTKMRPIHHRSPAKVFYRCVRGMVPHKMKRGECAMSRLTCFEGVPSPYDKKKRVVVPKALKVIRMEKSRNFTCLGDLCNNFGWKHASLVQRLEAKRISRGNAYHAAKTAKAKKVPTETSVDAKLATFGY
eukprot:GSMAST32.ASY1.ANO1.1117.1 assembled CDS